MTPTQWSHHIKAWRQSGQSKHAYCRNQGIAYSRFLYWSNKKAKPISESVIPNSDSELLPVTISDNESVVNCLGVLEFPNGTKLHIHSTQLLSSLPALLST